MNRTSRTHLIEWIAVFVIFTSTGLLTAASQHPIRTNGGRGWDGLHYFKLANKIGRFLTEGRPVAEVREPFIYRPGMPFLVALLGRDNLINGFLIVNLIGALLVAALFVVWLRLFIHDWRIRVLLNGLMITQWYGLVRYTYFYPTLIDTWVTLFLVAGLILVHKESLRPHWTHVAALTLLAFVGGFFKETVALIPIALLGVYRPVSRISRTFPPVQFRNPLQIPRQYWLPIVASAASFVITRSIVTPGESYSYAGYMGQMLLEKPPTLYVLGLLYAFGPILTLTVFDWKNLGKFLFSCQHLLVFLLGGMFLVWYGGADTERISLTVAPMIYLLIGMALENVKTVLNPIFWGVLGLSQAVAQRLFWVIPPEYQPRAPLVWPILTVPGNKVQYFDLFSYYARPEVSLAALGEYLLLAAALLLWLRTLKRSQPAPSGAAAALSTTNG